jgi:hypothetical protein
VVRLGIVTAWLGAVAVLIFAIGGWLAWIGYAVVAYYAAARLLVFLVRSRTLRDALERARDADSQELVDVFWLAVTQSSTSRLRSRGSRESP